MFKRKSNYKAQIETNISEIKALFNRLKSLVWQTELKQVELKKKVSEYESLVKQTENTIKDINKFKVKAKVRGGK